MVPPVHDESPRVPCETVEEWRAWLAEHHAQEQHAWLVSWRTHTGRPSVGYDDAVTEALAEAVDPSHRQRLDDDRTMLWFARRRPTSGWSRPNKVRVERLLAEGRMQPAGQAALDAARANGTWSLLDEVEDLVVPPDLAELFAAAPGSLETWEALTRSVRRATLEWIVTAKRPATRAARVARTAERVARGERPWP